ncbi:type IV secretion system protein VirB3 [Brucella intermedia]|uniref:type IV secretion system protein VirB3 n=1 Tax=Brucella intermedia TaxID=94625 RepID=UPI00235EE5CD|nr:VirB3 family type IV secretion system protein [Brucella intermedia]
MEDDLPVLEPVSLALTRPPVKWGVRYEIFALNGMINVIVFVASGSFLIPIVTAILVHGIAVYLCQRDPYIFHILERLVMSKRAVRNLRFWGARSYSP